MRALMSPATLVIILLVGILLIVGSLILAGGGRAARLRSTCPHDGCEHRNAPEARFCGKCGRPIQPSDAPPR